MSGSKLLRGEATGAKSEARDAFNVQEESPEAAALGARADAAHLARVDVR